MRYQIEKKEEEKDKRKKMVALKVVFEKKKI